MTAPLIDQLTDDRARQSEPLVLFDHGQPAEPIAVQLVDDPAEVVLRSGEDLSLKGLTLRRLLSVELLPFATSWGLAGLIMLSPVIFAAPARGFPPVFYVALVAVMIAATWPHAVATQLAASRNLRDRIASVLVARDATLRGLDHLDDDPDTVFVRLRMDRVDESRDDGRFGIWWDSGLLHFGDDGVRFVGGCIEIELPHDCAFTVQSEAAPKSWTRPLSQRIAAVAIARDDELDPPTHSLRFEPLPTRLGDVPRRGRVALADALAVRLVEAIACQTMC